jgi:hypothetical protein
LYPDLLTIIAVHNIEPRNALNTSHFCCGVFVAFDCVWRLIAISPWVQIVAVVADIARPKTFSDKCRAVEATFELADPVFCEYIIFLTSRTSVGFCLVSNAMRRSVYLAKVANLEESSFTDSACVEVQVEVLAPRIALELTLASGWAWEEIGFAS